MITNKRKFLLIALIIILIPLTYIKFTTASIHTPYSADTPSNIVSTNPSFRIVNHYTIDTTGADKNAWYNTGDYKVLYMSSMSSTIYNILILLWWVITIYLSIQLKHKLSSKVPTTNRSTI